MGKKAVGKKKTTKDTVPLCIQEVSQRGPVHGIFFSIGSPGGTLIGMYENWEIRTQVDPKSQSNPVCFWTYYRSLSVNLLMVYHLARGGSS